MKVAHFQDPLMGIIADVYLSDRQEQEWQQSRLQAFDLACEDAIKKGAERILITGSLFSDDYVAHDIVSRTFQLMSEKKIDFILMPSKSDKQIIRYQGSIPANLTVLDDDNSSDELGSNWGAAFHHDQAVMLENYSFDNPENSGYYLVELAPDRTYTSERVELALHRFATIRVEVEKTDHQQSVFLKCISATKGLTGKDFVRIVLFGAIDVDAFIQPDELCDKLRERFYYLEVFSTCELELNEQAYGNDISLKSEFVRLVLADNTLSEAEKSRIVQCGWNALRGKELSE